MGKRVERPDSGTSLALGLAPPVPHKLLKRGKIFQNKQPGKFTTQKIWKRAARRAAQLQFKNLKKIVPVVNQLLIVRHIDH